MTVCVDEVDTYLWHQRMGHLNFLSLEKMTENADGANIPKIKGKLTCLTCQEGKLTRLPFKSQGIRSEDEGEVLH